MAEVSRREFGKLAALTGCAVTLPDWASRSDPMIGIQVGTVSFVDEGVEAVLDRLQRDAAVNTLFIAGFSYGRGIAGRKVPGQPLPNHGKQEYDRGFRGGNFARVHPQYYTNTSLKDIQARDYGDFARGRGPHRARSWNEDDLLVRGRVSSRSGRHRPAAGGDVSGQKASTLCFHNPEVHAFWAALTEDFVRSYPIDGIMWGSERQGNAIRSVHGGGGGPTSVTCFCDYCKQEATRRGMDVQRAIEGYTRLAGLVRTPSRPGPPQFLYITTFRKSE